jgi:hypothetical protein
MIIELAIGVLLVQDAIGSSWRTATEFTLARIEPPQVPDGT